MSVTALKTKYSFKTKTYAVEAVFDANVLLAHEGYVVFDDAKRAFEDIATGRLIDSWKDAKKVAVLEWLADFLEKNEASDDDPTDFAALRQRIDRFRTAVAAN